MAAAAGCVFAAFGTVAADGSRTEAAAEPVTTAGAVVRSAAEATVIAPADRPAAPATAGDDLGGKPVGLDDFRGQVVVVNVWGSWCGPCRAEADDLARIERRTRDRGVRFLGINTRDPDRATARSFVRTHGLDFPSLHDPTGELLLRFPPPSSTHRRSPRPS